MNVEKNSMKIGLFMSNFRWSDVSFVDVCSSRFLQKFYGGMLGIVGIMERFPRASISHSPHSPSSCLPICNTAMLVSIIVQHAFSIH